MKTIFLEFAHEATPDRPAALGTDVIFHIDGRWGYHRASSEIYKRVAHLRAKRPALANMRFLGYTVSGDSANNWPVHRMRDIDPPDWAVAAKVSLPGARQRASVDPAE